MKKKGIAKTALLIGLTVCALGRCVRRGTKEPQAFGRKTADDSISGTIVMAGSTSMEKLANAAAEFFMEAHPNVTVTVEFTGSSAGIEAVLAGNVDIGNSSRLLREEEKRAGAVENVVAIDGIAVITDVHNPVRELTQGELSDIYTGKIRNWREVGGADEAIVVVGREAGSGTRQSFEELLGIEGRCAYANELDAAGAVMAKAVTIPGVIGYVSLDVLDGTVQALSIDGAEPDADNLQKGSYLLARPFVMTTNGAMEEQSALVQMFFACLKSDDGKRIIESAGLIVPY